MEQGKIVKVTFKYENTTESLSGEQAKKWLDMVNGMCVFLDNRGANPFANADFKWKKEK